VIGFNRPFEIIRLVVFAGVPFVLGWRLWLLRKAQHGGDDPDGP
jgi:hypothetical protein